MGLRETKKQKMRASIIENAIGLFREQGFEATTVRGISLACEMSEATFFNYFSTKDAVLSAWAHGLVERHFEPENGLAESRLRPSVRRLCDCLALTLEGDRDFAARAWAKAKLPLGPPDGVVGIFETGQAAGELRRDLSARQLGGIFYAAVCGTLADWLAREEPRGSLGSELRSATDLVLDGSRRRNERVKPALGAAPQALR